MYVIKHVPEDFVVEEVPVIKPSSSGKHLLFLLEKRNRTTQEVVSFLRARFGLRQSDIGFAGSKDKRAVTKQFITIRSKKGLSRDFNFKDFKLKFLGFTDHRLLLGDLLGNNFRIVVRNVNPNMIGDLMPVFPKQDFVFFPNYFGEQRFSKDNFDIGVAFLKKKFDVALSLIMKTLNNERLIKRLDLKLEKSPNDFLGCLRLLPKELLLLYIHSVQSLIFNKTLALLLKEKEKEVNNHNSKSERSGSFVVPVGGVDLYFPSQGVLKQFFNKDLPIIGFATKVINKDDKQSQEQSLNNLWNIALEKQVSMLESLGLDQKNFLIKQAPELSVEGSSRKAVVRAERFSFSVDNDEFNPGMKKVTLSFFLPKGSYATIFIKYLFKC